MNTDRLTKTYLEELVNHSYLEREQNEEKKSKEYVYTPLVDIEEEASTEEQADNGDDNNNPAKSSKLGHFNENLQFSKLLLPENHQGIPEDWLKREILQLQSDRIEGSVFKIIDQNGDEMPIDDFIKGYENGSRGLRLQHFIKVPSRFDASKTVEITASEDKRQDKNSSKPLDFDHFDRLHERSSQVSPIALTNGQAKQRVELVQKAMQDTQGNNKEYLTKEEYIYCSVMEPNYHCTEDQAEQVFYALIEEGKIVEIELGKYKLNTTQEEKGE
jgi:hypothetical protein